MSYRPPEKPFIPKWARDYLILPLIVGLVIAAVTLGVPFLLKERLQLSYEIEGPTSLLDDPATEGVEILVNGSPVSDLVAYRVRLWNSGDRPIKNLPVRIGFDAADEGFMIFTVSHLTRPRHEFGEIRDLEALPGGVRDPPPRPPYRRYQYELLNPADQDIVTLLTNSPSNIEVSAKAEGLHIKRHELSEGTGQTGWTAWLSQGAITLAALGAMLAVLGRRVLERRLESMHAKLREAERSAKRRDETFATWQAEVASRSRDL